jgi:hypothetical protein
MARRRRKNRRKSPEKTGENIRFSPELSVDLRTPNENSPKYFMGCKLLKGNELWRWDNLADVKF